MSDKLIEIHGSKYLEVVGEVEIRTEIIPRLARKLCQMLAGKTETVVLTAVLEGSTRFREALLSEMYRIGQYNPAYRFNIELDSVSVSSYRDKTISGEIFLLKDFSRPIAGKTVVLVEDILDSRHTMGYLAGLTKWKKPAQLIICALLDKPAGRDPLVDLNGIPTLIGKEIPNLYVFGFGLDKDGRFREFPSIVTDQF